MKLEIECSWDDNKNKVKQTIYFEYRPKAIFRMPVEKIVQLQKLIQSARMEGPQSLQKVGAFVEQFPKSLYVLLNYYKLLQFFEYSEEAQQVFVKIKKLFPEEIFVKCLIGERLLAEKKYKEFSEAFHHIEVLKGAFPKRREFFYEEALLFHNLWGRYFFETQNELQAEKHNRFVLLIINMLRNCELMKASSTKNIGL